jgi:ABC-type Fe3+/spermidine/putrescine transport system ATPase subunit
VNVVEVEGLQVELGGRAVLGPIDLALPERSWTLFVGPSGSGKTTLLRAVAGLVRPSAGEVRIDGRPASRGPRIAIPPEERRIGFVFQGAGAGLWPHLSVRATLDFVLSLHGVRGAERRGRIEELIELVGLRQLEKRRPGELSGGEAQRLALARALAVRPRLLLLDEPLAALDAPLRRGLIEALAELHRRLGPTILQVTHDPGEVDGLADRTIALEAGRLRDEASP